MNINDIVLINPYGCGNKHVGIISSITSNTVCCKEWYGITTPNLVENASFFKNTVQKVSIQVFNRAKRIWEKNK